MSTHITVQKIDNRHYVGVRRTVRMEEIAPTCAEVLPRVGQWLAERGIAPASAPMTIYHSVDREKGVYDLQPGFFVSNPVDADGDITPGETGAGDVVTTTHVGGYESIGDTWHAVFDHAGSLERPVTRASWEIYIDDPGEVPPEKLRTEIFVPVDPT